MDFLKEEENQYQNEDEKLRSTDSNSFKQVKIMDSILKYRHMYGIAYKPEKTFFNLMPDLSAMDSPVIR